jgi:hypothetical protein
MRGKVMSVRARNLTVPEIMLIGGTRVVLGAGLGLLISGKLSEDQRKGAGWALLAVGALTSIPIVMGVLAKAPIIKDAAA